MKEYNFIKKIEKLIQEEELIKPGEKIVLGISGGADSVCLLLALNDIARRPAWSLELYPVHVNHGIRGEEAKRDEAFVIKLCNELGLTAECFHEDVPKLSKELSMSAEEAGRAARYRDFAKVCKKHGCKKIAVAHNADDQTETILFNMIRGCSLNGLAGMSVLSDCAFDKELFVIRPLIETNRAEIEDYLLQKGAAWCTDSTNLDDEYTRNIIRHSLIPKLTEISPKACSHINSLAREGSQVKEFIDDYCDMLFMDSFMAYSRQISDKNIKSVDEEPSWRKNNSRLLGSLRLTELENRPEFIIREVVYRFICTLTGQKKDIEKIHVIDVCNLIENSVGKMVYLPYDINIIKDYDTLMGFRRTKEVIIPEEEPDVLSIKEFDSIDAAALGKAQTIKLEFGKKSMIEVTLLDRASAELSFDNKEKIYFDKEKLFNLVRGDLSSLKLEVRVPMDGDYLCPFPDGGRKTLRRFFIDSKISASEREKMPLLCLGSRCLVVGSLRHDETLRVDEFTKELFEIVIKSR